MEKLIQVLCGLDNLLRGLIGKVEAEYKPVSPSLSVVGLAGNVEPQKIAGQNPFRSELWIHNAGDKDLYIAPSVGEIGPLRYSLPIAPKDTMYINPRTFPSGYKGDFYGFWESGAVASSKAMITEFSIKGL